jgi:hypothetical protein
MFRIYYPIFGRYSTDNFMSLSEAKQHLQKYPFTARIDLENRRKKSFAHIAQSPADPGHREYEQRLLKSRMIRRG